MLLDNVIEVQRFGGNQATRQEIAAQEDRRRPFFDDGSEQFPIAVHSTVEIGDKEATRHARASSKFDAHPCHNGRGSNCPV